jgi:hypothetical protein
VREEVAFVNGINRLLKLAATDQAFANELLLNRRAAVMTRGLQLTDVELAILDSVDNKALALMIQSAKGGERYAVDPEKMTLTGISPDRPPPRAHVPLDPPRPDRSFGISPDRPGPPVDPWKPPRREHF